MDFTRIISEYYLWFSVWIISIKFIEIGIIWIMSGFLRAFKNTLMVSSIPILGLFINQTNFNLYVILCIPFAFELIGTAILLYNDNLLNIKQFLSLLIIRNKI